MCLVSDRTRRRNLKQQPTFPSVSCHTIKMASIVQDPAHAQPMHSEPNTLSMQAEPLSTVQGTAVEAQHSKTLPAVGMEAGNSTSPSSSLTTASIGMSHAEAANMEAVLAHVAGSPAFQAAVDQLATALASSSSGHTGRTSGTGTGTGTGSHLSVHDMGHEDGEHDAQVPASPEETQAILSSLLTTHGAALPSILSTLVTLHSHLAQGAAVVTALTRALQGTAQQEQDSDMDGSASVARALAFDCSSVVSSASEPSHTHPACPWRELAATMEQQVHGLEAQVALQEQEMTRLYKDIEAKNGQLERARQALESHLAYISAGRAMQSRTSALTDEMEELRATNAQLAIMARCAVIESMLAEREKDGMQEDADATAGGPSPAPPAVANTSPMRGPDGQAHSESQGEGEGEGEGEESQDGASTGPRDAAHAGMKRGRQERTSQFNPWLKRARRDNVVLPAVQTQDPAAATGAGAGAGAGAAGLLTPARQLSERDDTIMLDLSEKAILTAKLKVLQDEHADATLKLRVLTSSLRKVREEALARNKEQAVAKAEEIRLLKEAHAKEVAALKAQLVAAQAHPPA